MQHPTEVVLNIQNSPVPPPRIAPWHTRCFFTWEKTHMCFCLSAYVSGGKKGFLGGYFLGFWANLLKNHGGNFFMGKVVYVLLI